MPIITKSDFDNWKADPVTKAFMFAINERIEESKDVLSVQAGINPNEDNYLRGFIQAYREIQDFRVEDAQETEA